MQEKLKSFKTTRCTTSADKTKNTVISALTAHKHSSGTMEQNQWPHYNRTIMFLGDGFGQRPHTVQTKFCDVTKTRQECGLRVTTASSVFLNTLIISLKFLTNRYRCYCDKADSLMNQTCVCLQGPFNIQLCGAGWVQILTLLATSTKASPSHQPRRPPQRTREG